MEKTVFCGEKIFGKPLKWAFLKLEFFLHVIFITFTRLPHMTFMKVRKLDSFDFYEDNQQMQLPVAQC